jgi:hypothetical protein
MLGARRRRRPELAGEGLSVAAQDVPPRPALVGEGLQRVPLIVRRRKTRFPGRSSPENVFSAAAEDAARPPSLR